MLRFKPEVRIRQCGAALAEILALASEWALVSGIDVEVNSIDDGQHSATSLHGQSLAIDLDPATDLAHHTRALARYLAQRLSPTWQVLLESDHVHAEFDTGRRI